MIDTNAQILDTQLQKNVRSGNLYDLLASKHGVNSPSTYIRGMNTIDYVFGTTKVKESIKNNEILTFNLSII